ncbi:MAG: LOG family protein [Candidatus Shapirobacteria bacterium]|nr:LOG family protein [Candidatus Shapirobacteria bacterium]
MLSITKKKIKRIAIFGDADAKETDQHYIDAFNTAKLLAQNGYIIVNGGGPGVMLASTLGTKSVNGKVEAVIIDEKVDMGKNYEGPAIVNKKNVDEIYRTKNIQNRTEKIVELADAHIVFKGGTGTMAELALVWEKAKFEYGKHEPLIFYGDCWKNTIETLIENLNFDKIERKVYEFADSPEEVLKIIKNKKGFKRKINIGLFGNLRNLIDKF